MQTNVKSYPKIFNLGDLIELKIQRKVDGLPPQGKSILPK